MYASDIIRELQRLIEIHGDVPVKTLIDKESIGRIHGTVEDVRYKSSDLSAKPTIQLVAR